VEETAVVTMIYPETDEQADEEIRIPAGGTIMPLDWDAVARAFEGANAEFGWDADFEIRPERRHVWINVPYELRSHVSKTTIDFYNAVAERMGEEEFNSVWIDFGLKSK
jgi:hypothetical protein